MNNPYKKLCCSITHFAGAECIHGTYPVIRPEQQQAQKIEQVPYSQENRIRIIKLVTQLKDGIRKP